MINIHNYFSTLSWRNARVSLCRFTLAYPLSLSMSIAWWSFMPVYVVTCHICLVFRRRRSNDWVNFISFMLRDSVSNLSSNHVIFSYAKFANRKRKHVHCHLMWLWCRIDTVDAIENIVWIIELYAFILSTFYITYSITVFLSRPTPLSTVKHSILWACFCSIKKICFLHNEWWFFVDTNSSYKESFWERTKLDEWVW